MLTALLLGLAPWAPQTVQAAAPPPAGRLVVLNKAGASASLLDLATGVERARLPVGVGPHEVALLPDGHTAVVANYGAAVPGSSLTLLDLVAERPVRTVDLGQAARPHGIVAEADGAHVWVTAEQRKSLLRVRLADGAVVQEISTPQPIGHMVAQGGGALFVSHIGGGGVTPVRPAAHAAAGAAGDSSAWRNLPRLLRPGRRAALLRRALAARIFRARLRRPRKADRAGGRLLEEFGDSPVPIGIVVPPSGAQAYVALTNADRIAEVDLTRRAVVRWLRAGREPDGMAWYPEPARQTR